MRHAVCTVVLVFGALLALPAAAANEISTDITVDLGGTLTDDEDAVEDAAGSVTPIDLGALPAAADLIGYSIASSGDVLFSLDIAASLPGGIDVTPRDVVRWNGSAYSIELDGADHAIPAGAKIDAIGVVAGDLLLSFDVTVALGNVTADDEDLVRLESTVPDLWSLYFDGSAEGVPAGADLDGADLLDQNGNLALSFDISGSVGGVAFDDEDILEFVQAGGTWSKRFDGSSAYAALAAADVDAVFVPEPMALGAGAAALFGLLTGTRRRRSGSLLVLAGLASTLASPAFAADGALEINQACVATGCGPGDTAGFPVTTQSGRKYVLTSDLIVTNSSTSGVSVAAASTLDLNGFSISGPNTCPGSPPVCGFASGGTGVALGDGASVRNGAVRGMGGDGVVIGADGQAMLAVVEDLWIDQNGAGGIAGGVSDGSIIRGCRVSRNGGTAIGLAGGNGSPGSIISDNVIYGNAGVGIQVNSAMIRGNNIRSNGGLALQITYIDSSSGFGDNVINGNNGGNANPQTSGGHQIGINVCGDKLTCP